MPRQCSLGKASWSGKIWRFWAVPTPSPWYLGKETETQMGLINHVAWKARNMYCTFSIIFPALYLSFTPQWKIPRHDTGWLVVSSIEAEKEEPCHIRFPKFHCSCSCCVLHDVLKYSWNMTSSISSLDLEFWHLASDSQCQMLGSFEFRNHSRSQWRSSKARNEFLELYRHKLHASAEDFWGVWTPLSQSFLACSSQISTFNMTNLISL